MSECDCCGYDGADLSRYRGMMQDVLNGLVEKRTAELQAENQRLRDGIDLHRTGIKMRAGSLPATPEDVALWALLGGEG